MTGRTVRGSVLILAGSIAACTGPAVPAQSPRGVAGIDTLVIRRITRDLAHDSLTGRGTGTPGSAAAARIIEQACREAGLQSVAGSFRHAVPLTRTDIHTGTVLTIHAGPNADPTPFTDTADFVVRPSVAGTLRDFRGPAIYAGNESSIREAAALPPLRGAAAVTLGIVSPAAAAHLAAEGARAVVQIVPDSAQFGQLLGSRNRTLWALGDSTITTSHVYPLPAVALGPGPSAALANAARPGAGGRPRFDRDISVRFATTTTAVIEYNITCALPGAGGASADTALVYTAHYDHLGMRPAVSGTDSVFNGFSDNAAGVGMLLAIARAMRGASRAPQNTVLFVFLAAEEVGLLGSEYFVHAPPWPLSRIKAVINLDAGAPPAKPWTWRVAGGDSTAIGQLAVAVAARNGWSAVTSAATPNSDYYPFWQRGVPSIFIIPGPAKYEGITADSSNALRRRWDRYHQPGDEWSADFPFEGVGRYARYALEVGWAVIRE